MPDAPMPDARKPDARKPDARKPDATMPGATMPDAATPPAHLRIVHPFDVALAVRGRRKQLKLRQSEVARAAGVGREWLVELEHGKPTVELGLVLRTLAVLGVELDVLMPRRPPAWTLPLTAAAQVRRARLAATRPRKPRPDVAPPADYPGRHLREDG